MRESHTDHAANKPDVVNPYQIALKAMRGHLDNPTASPITDDNTIASHEHHHNVRMNWLGAAILDLFALVGGLVGESQIAQASGAEPAVATTVRANADSGVQSTPSFGQERTDPESAIFTFGDGWRSAVRGSQNLPFESDEKTGAVETVIVRLDQHDANELKAILEKAGVVWMCMQYRIGQATILYLIWR